MKKDMITRTLVSTAVTVLGVNEVSAETYYKTVVFPGVIKDKEKALAMVKKHLSADELFEDYHPAVVVSMEKREQLLGITVEDFMAHAVPVKRPESQTKEARAKKNKEAKEEAAFFEEIKKSFKED